MSKQPHPERWKPVSNTWLSEVVVHPDGRIELRFDDGRRLDAVEILNDKMETITSAQVQVMPGEGVLFATSPGAAIVPLATPDVTAQADAAGIYSVVYSRASAGRPAFLFRTPGSITDAQVMRRCGGGNYRVDIVRKRGNTGPTEYLSTRDINLDANSRPYGPPY